MRHHDVVLISEPNGASAATRLLRPEQTRPFGMEDYRETCRRPGESVPDPVEVDRVLECAECVDREFGDEKSERWSVGRVTDGEERGSGRSSSWLATGKPR